MRDIRGDPYGLFSIESDAPRFLFGEVQTSSLGGKEVIVGLLEVRRRTTPSPGQRNSQMSISLS